MGLKWRPGFDPDDIDNMSDSDTWPGRAYNDQYLSITAEKRKRREAAASMHRSVSLRGTDEATTQTEPQPDEFTPEVAEWLRQPRKPMNRTQRYYAILESYFLNDTIGKLPSLKILLGKWTYISVGAALSDIYLD